MPEYILSNKHGAELTITAPNEQAALRAARAENFADLKPLSKELKEGATAALAGGAQAVDLPEGGKFSQGLGQSVSIGRELIGGGMTGVIGGSLEILETLSMLNRFAESKLGGVGTARTVLPLVLGGEVYFNGDKFTWREHTTDAVKAVLETLNKSMDSLQPRTTGGKFVKSVSQFVVPFGMYAKGITSLGMSNQLMRYLAAGAFTDFSAFDGMENNLSKWLSENVEFTQPVTNFLAAETPEDEADVLLNKIKSSAEGLFIGGALDAFVSSLRFVRATRLANAQARAQVASNTPTMHVSNQIPVGPQPTAGATAAKKKRLPFKQDPLPQVNPMRPANKGQRRLAEFKAVHPDVQEDIARAAEKALVGDMDGSRRLFTEISELLQAGDIDVQHLPGLLKRNNITAAEFAQEYARTVSESARALQRLSLTSRRIRTLFKNDQAALKALGDVGEGHFPIINAFMDIYARVANVRRAFLTSQLATAMRNAFSATGRIGLDIADDTLQSTIRTITKVIKGQELTGGSFSGEFKGNFNHLAALGSIIHPKKHKALVEALSSKGFMADQALIRMSSATIHEGVLTHSFDRKLANVVNIFNRLQETFFRRVSFEHKLRQIAARKGVRFSELVDKPHLVSTAEVREAVEHSLQMTFAASPKSKLAREWYTVIRDTPFLDIIVPFPRFVLGNALPFMFEFNPLALMNTVATAAGRKALGFEAIKNVDIFAKEVSRGLIGTGLFWGAWELLQSDLIGEHWWEINGPDGKVTDARSWTPLASALLFADVTQKVLRGEVLWKDVKELLKEGSGITRPAGTTLPLVQLLLSDDPGRQEALVRAMVGQYIGSFSVPVRTLKDLSTPFADEETIFRDFRDRPELAPFVSNIPGMSRDLPPATSPWKVGILRSEHPIMRQLTGVNLRTKGPVEREFDRLRLNPGVVFARTGNPEANRLINGNTAQILEHFAIPIIQTEKYQNLSTEAKRFIFSEVLKEARKQATKLANVQDPELMAEVTIAGRFSRTERELLESIGITLPK